jgi:phage-related tail protein
MLDFADGQSAQYALLLPSDWTGAIDARAIFFDSSTSGTVIFQIATACAPVGGTVTDNTAFNAADSFATITLNSAANAQWETTKTGVNTAGCSAGDTLQVKISRTTDTAANLARLKGVELTVRRSL